MTLFVFHSKTIPRSAVEHTLRYIRYYVGREGIGEVGNVQQIKTVHILPQYHTFS